MLIRDIIRKNLLLEKRIGQVSAKVEFVLGFDIVKTKHTTERMNVSDRELSGGRDKPITNGEMLEFVKNFTKDIAEGIVSEEINDQEDFILKSREWELSMVIIPYHISGSYWRLIIKTVFPESESHQLRVGKDQVLFEL
jgi:hypothetical protein|tara:strand:- start:374 stop:790 length:417 start_codon:yes stop_codon:yes gene_type:complete